MDINDVQVNLEKLALNSFVTQRQIQKDINVGTTTDYTYVDSDNNECINMDLEKIIKTALAHYKKLSSA